MRNILTTILVLFALGLNAQEDTTKLKSMIDSILAIPLEDIFKEDKDTIYGQIMENGFIRIWLSDNTVDTIITKYGYDTTIIEGLGLYLLNDSVAFYF